VNNFHDFRASVLCRREPGNKWYGEGCILLNCKDCGRELKLPYCMDHVLNPSLLLPGNDPQWTDLLEIGVINEKRLHMNDYVSINALATTTRKKKNGTQKIVIEKI